MKSVKYKILNQYIPILLITGILGGLPGCIENFNYEQKDTSDSYLVVDGGLTNLPVKQVLKLSRSSVYGSIAPNPEGGDSVWILEDGKAVDYCREISPGFYQIDGDLIDPQPGKSYSIKIKSFDGRRQYESSPEVMPGPVSPDSANFELKEEKVLNDLGYYMSSWVININVTTPVRGVNNSSAYFRWSVPEMYDFIELYTGPLSHPHTCYINDSLTYQTIQIFDSHNLQGGVLKNHLIYTRFPQPDQEFFYVHYFNVQQYSITRSAYDYWFKLKQVANPTGSFMDTPPAAVIGNVYNVKDKNEPVLGYFEVSAMVTVHVKTVPEVLQPYWVQNPCTKFPPPGFCFNCLSLPNSSLVRPSYW